MYVHVCVSVHCFTCTLYICCTHDVDCYVTDSSGSEGESDGESSESEEDSETEEQDQEPGI